MIDALVIGAGPAGLMAAQELALAGRHVVVTEAKPSVGRKLLMAGKSGLNLTKDEPFDIFLPHYGAGARDLEPYLRSFGNREVQDWATGLGQEVFTGSSGRVFPKSMKASPLLRTWLGQLAGLGVEFRTKWRWQGWQGDAPVFETSEGQALETPKATVLALGGASWSRLGSDGAWAPLLQERGVAITRFAPSNAGLMVDWSPHMSRHFGAPLKGVALRAGNHFSRGEMVITQSGLEGGGVYSMSGAVRDGAPLYVDLLPDIPVEKIVRRLAAPRKKATLTNHLRKFLNLPPAKQALLMEFGRPLPTGPELATLIKALPIRHAGLRPLDEAISTAGGISFDAVDRNLMLKALPGVFAAGEMLDWDAPTGGYLLTACLSTGRWAGQKAAGWAKA